MLDRLVALRLIERVRPVTEGERSRRRIYRIADNFLAFYLDVLSRHRTEIDAGMGPSLVPVLVDALDDHQGPRWEAAFREQVRRMATTGALGDRIVAVGPYWTADGHDEIDVVALAGRARTPVLVGEATWARRVAAPRLVAGLLRKAPAVPGMVDDPQLLLCAREEVVQVPDGVRTVTAADVFA